MAMGAAASDFGYDRAVRNERLLSDLVYEVLGQQADQENHDEALTTCLKTSKHHRFADTEPKQMERLYTDLGERMESLAQFRKQRALVALSAALLELDLHSDTPEVNHRILSLLYYSARRPLNAHYDPTHVALELLHPGSADSVAAEEVEELSEDEGKVSLAYQSDSELSEWTDPDAVDDEWVDEVVEEAAEGVSGEGELPEPEVWAPPSRSTYAKPAQPQRSARVRPEAGPNCLFQKLAESRCHDVPFSVPLPTSCTSQPALACQVISMMRGSTAPGPAFVWRAAAGRFAVAQGVHVADLSPSALQEMLFHFADAGAVAVRLWQAVSGMHAVEQQWPTWTAFLTELRRQLHDLVHQLESTETAASRDLPRGNLLQLRAELQGVMRRMRLLAEILRKADTVTRAGEAAERSACLLTALHGLMGRASLHSGPYGREQAACLLRLLAAALMPCLGALDTWLREGALPHAHEEFFVRQDARVSVESRDFWTQAYSLRTDARGAPACADFLASAATHILDAGKALLLLRGGNSAVRRPATQDGALASCDASREPLPQEFLRALQAALKGKTGGIKGRQNQKGGRSAFFEAPATPIAERMADAAGGCCSTFSPPALLPATPDAPPQACPAITEAPPIHLQYQTEEEVWQDSPCIRARLDELAGVMSCPGGSRSAAIYAGAVDLSPLQAQPGRAGGWALVRDPQALSGLPGWLDEVQEVALPPPSVLLKRCLLHSINARVSWSSGQLLAALGGLPLLRQQLAAMRNLFLGGCPVLLPLVHSLVSALLGGSLLTQLPASGLQASLEDCLAGHHAEPLPLATDVTVTVSGEEHAKISSGLRAAQERRLGKEGASGELPRTLVEIQAMSLDCSMPWPLALVLDDEALRLYNSVLAFLIQLKWAKEAVRIAAKCSGEATGPAVRATGQRLLHLVCSLEHFVTYSFAAAWQRLQRELEGVGSIQEVQRLHQGYLEAVARPCMGSGDATWLLIHGVLRKLLDLCLRYHELLTAPEEPEATQQALTKLQADFMDRHRYLLKSLTAKSLKIGDDSGLQYLVMLLDFNSFYQRSS